MVNSLKALENQTGPANQGNQYQIEEQKTYLKSNLEREANREQELRTTEVELSTQLQKEQSIPYDLTEKLNVLEKKLQHIR